jgi:hypothetical protein
VTRLNSVRHEYVECIPEQLKPGTLYISKRFKTASHLCCCGCGMRVVTPLNPAKWRLTDHGANVSLSPSIGNWNFPCRSHYLIVRNHVRWAGQISQRQAVAVQRRDRIDVERHAEGKSVLTLLSEALRRFFG